MKNMKKNIFTVNLLLIAIITSAQVAYWPLNGDAIDFSGSGNDGVVNGATIASDVNGISGGALYFTSGNDVQFASSEPFNFYAEMTVSFWMKSQSTNTVDEMWFSKSSCSINPESSWFICMKNGKFGFFSAREGTSQTNKFYSLQQYNDNQWHHVVIAFSAPESKLKFYKDGILDVSYNLPSPSFIDLGGSSFSISLSGCGTSDGTLDEVKFFDFAMPDVEVQQIYSEGVPPPPPAAAGEISGNNFACLGDVNVEYYVPPIEGATGYVWELPEGATISSGANTESINVDFSSSAVSGNVSVYGINSQFNGVSSTIEINVGKPEPAGAINGKNFVAPGDIVSYSISEVDGAIDYEWELSGIATIISGENTNSIQVNVLSSSGLIKVTPINSCGGGASSSIMVTVGDIITSGSITINPFSADNNYLLFKTDETNLGIIGSDAKLYSEGNSDNLGMYVYGDNNLEFSTNNTKRLSITGSGDVGIGTTTPSKKLDVHGDINMEGDLYKNGVIVDFGAWGVEGENIYYNAGNVGIGTTSPNNVLDIVGEAIELGSNEVDNTAKYSRILSKHYSNNELPMIVAMGGSANGVNDARIGGGTVSGNAATKITFWTAANSITAKGTQKMIIDNDGNLGIGTSSPLGKVDILAATDEVALRLSMPTSEDAAAYDIKWANTNADVVHRIQYSSTYYDFMNVNRATRNVSFNGGNVAIGTTSFPSGYKLAVDGKVICEEITIEMSDNWADFVFEPTYNLMSLNELDTYIQENKHLPEIPTTAEVKENGISVGEMNAKLLQKIEELTLYVIELKKEVETLKEQNNN